MPLYEYKCESCGKRFEVLQKFSDEPLTVHEECGGKAERLLSAPAFHFKGTGWYVTDYAKGNGTSKPAESKSEKADKAESSGTSEKTEKTSEAKPESKPAESRPAATTTDSK